MQNRMEMMPKKHRQQMMDQTAANNYKDANAAQTTIISPVPQREGTQRNSITMDSKQSGKDNKRDNDYDMRYVNTLTLLQKVQIIVFNSMEAIFVSAYLSNAVVWMNLSTVYGIVVSFILLTQMNSASNIELKKRCVGFVAVIAVLVCLTKIGFGIVLNQKGLIKNNWYQSFGLIFESPRQVSLLQSVRSEFYFIAISLFYFVYLLKYQSDKIRIKRVVTRIVQISRTRAYHNDQISEQHSERSKSVFKYPQGKKSKNQLLNRSIVDGELEVIQPRSKQINEKVNESIINHPYFGQFRNRIFIILGAMILLDTALYQSVPQLIQYAIVLISLALWSRSPLPVDSSNPHLFKALKQMGCLALFIQMMHVLQIYLTYGLNIAMVKQKLTGQNTTKSDLLRAFGIYFQAENQTYHITSHLVASSFIIVFCSLFRNSTRIFLEQNPDIAFHSNENTNVVDSPNFDYPSMSQKDIVSQASYRQAPGHLSLVGNLAGRQHSLKVNGGGRDRAFSHQYQLFNKSFLNDVGGKVQIETEVQNGFVTKIAPYVCYWISKLVAIILVYLHYDWQSLLILIWVLHSTLIREIKNFSQTTLKVYMTLVCLIALYYYTINVDQIVPDSLFEGNETYGFVKFKYPMIEVMIMQVFVVSLFTWIKLEHSVSESDEDLRSQGVNFALIMTQKDSYSIQNLILLSTSLIELVQLLLILFLGLDKVDLYHIIFMFLFVGFLVFPKHKVVLTELLIYYSALFILARYFLNLLDEKLYDKELMSIIGIYSNEQDIQQWIVLFVGYSMKYMQRVFEDKTEIEKCYGSARKTLRARFPGTNKAFQLIYNLKRNIILIMIFFVFYGLIQIQQRSMINWGFLIIIQGLFYVEIVGSERHQGWKVMIYYSSIVILVNTTFLFAQLVYDVGVADVSFEDILPKWYLDNQLFIGLQVLQEEDLGSSQIGLFIPYLIFFLFSVHIKEEFQRWTDEDMKFKTEIDERIVEENFVEGMLTKNQKSLNQNTDRTQLLEKLKQEKSEVSIQYNRIRFSPQFFAYSSKNFWPLIDLLAQYNIMFFQFIVLILSMFWWLNLVNIIHVLVFVSFNISLGSRIDKIRGADLKKYQDKRQLLDKDVMQQMKEYDEKLKKVSLEERMFTWKVQYMVISIALIVIYPSEFLENFGVNKKVIYGMFLSGVYHEGHASFFKNTWGYLYILAICIVERASLAWIKDRFGCDQVAYAIITKFEKKVKDIDDKINKVQEELEMEPLLERRRKMKELRGTVDEDMSFRRVTLKNQIKNEDSSDLKQELQKRILLDSQLMSLRGVSMVLESIIVFFIFASATVKMNIQSILYLLIVMVWQRTNDNKGSLRFLMSAVSCLLFLRLAIILSNLNPSISPMPFPKDFQTIPDDYWIPWIRHVVDSDDVKMAQWTYFLTLTVVNERVLSFVMDFGIIFSIYIFYQTSNFWLISTNNYEITYSQETVSMIKQYYGQLHGGNTPTSAQIEKLIKKIKAESWSYRFFKYVQRAANYQYPKVMVGMVFILAIMSNTLFSLGVIGVFCILMFQNKLFLDVQSAKKILKPILNDFVVPFIMIEILLHFVYQIPLEIFTKEKLDDTYHIAEYLGIYKYWEIIIVANNRQEYRFYKYTKVVQLACKALIYHIVKIQVKIIDSKSFYRLRDLLVLGQRRGQAMTWRFNNLKIKRYLKYQTLNLKKEQMMIKVKENCDKWRSLFERQAKEQYKYYEQDFSAQDYDKSPAPIRESNFTLNMEQINQARQGLLQNSYQPKQVERQSNEIKKKIGSYFQSVNSDYLAVRRLTQKQAMLGRQSSMLSNQFDEPIVEEVNDEDFEINDQNLDPRQLEEKKMFKEKKQQVGVMVWAYLKLRKRCVNPILFVNSHERMKVVLEDMRLGSTKARSSIEGAIMKDIDHELTTGNSTTKNYDENTTFVKMTIRFIKLIEQIVSSNLDIIAYICMIFATICNPGIITLVYPLSVFGFALMEETRPKQHFWNFIIFYTQVLLIVEFILSLKFWLIFSQKYSAIQLFCSQYYIGIQLTKPRDDMGVGNEISQLFIKFLPKILVLFSSMAFNHNEIILRLYEKKEQDKESMQQAYIRYIAGQFGIEIAEVVQPKQDLSPDEDIRYELNQTVFEYAMGKSLDDIGIDYYGNQDTQLIDTKKVLEFMDDYRPFKSEQDLFEDYQNDKKFEAVAGQKELRQQFRLYQSLKRYSYALLTENLYIRGLYPSLKIQKPGLDFYSLMVLIQVIMALYVLIFYPEMDAEHQTIVTQVNRNQFSAHMVVVLSCMIFLMIIDRYIYKSKSFRQADHQDDARRNEFRNLILPKNLKVQKVKIKTQYEIKSSTIAGDNQNGFQENKELIDESGSQGGKFNLDELLARSKITFRVVSKFYFQWLCLILIHGLLFFYLPIMGNLKYNQKSYCDQELHQSTPSYRCNDLNKNPAIAIFYILACTYLFVSAYQIKHGLPEVMTSYFMMGRFHWLNKYIFLVFYYIPFVFELRTFIDWTYTKTSLDVYQWIKLCQIQVDLYKSKCNQLFYMRKPVGEKMPVWYKNLVGVSFILLIFLLALGPMFLFSSFNFFGELNPVSSANVKFQLKVQGANGVLTTYKLFETQTVQQKISQLDDWQYDQMRMSQNYESMLSDKSQIQYLIMNNFPQEGWQITEPTKLNLLEDLKCFETENSTVKDNSKMVVSVEYQFTRASPKAALTPSGHQDIRIDPNNHADTKVINGFIEALNSTCDEQNKQKSIHSIVISDNFQPVISLGTTINAEIFKDAFWGKSINMTYDACQKFWYMNQIIDKSGYEFNLFDNVTSKSSLQMDQLGVSLFIVSKRALPSFLTYPLLTFYISIIYVLAKLFRGAFVPITASIFINDAPDPDDILMLCETIILYRLKEMLAEEEELFFLLVDIMRSPQVFKSICGESNKTRLKQQKQQIEKEEKLQKQKTLRNTVGEQIRAQRSASLSSRRNYEQNQKVKIE